MAERCAIVTGGGRNIGQAISLRLQQDGYRVFALDNAEPEVESLRADRVDVDLMDADATREAVAGIAARHQVRCLVNNVGIVAPAGFDDVDLADFDRLMHLNLRCAIVCAQALVPGMRAAGGGRIVFNTSRVTKGKKDRTLYSATKGAAQSMARTWALELARDGITVNCVAPGPIATTAFWANNPPDAPKTREIIDQIPVGRMGTPEDVANAVGFFCDDRAGFVTGQTLFVCGGVTVG
ncbi:NAD-dependent epimerase/dehydratase:Short-chain dehydrogenase/reductase SDR [Oceanicola granulosus HTCC2516]|uniref:NAD-dependent epimerase/dehydratase:Short-chain dehydrogenase/reductase SDR n=1 Tax=Oceanicola granulosus (strain ATCC BAA-861 / DSM 15982 / KCTC 12143 / HTCC2516) TaxID=314256 RepID=Q2CGV7_OCEGH|nr:SDR family oxidoreductase [Oceanicola granulosus]EAR51828.1 NAD-dependent epimerase/dehydratase:Short-chain dehydrogenase/reductase SDR [Oceanicola granulosus HTCC2516]